MMVNVKEGGDDRNLVWLWNLMDHETRYLLACRVSKARNAEDAQRPMQDAKSRTGGARPKAFITDSLASYVIAAKREFYENDGLPQNPHLRLPPLKNVPDRVHPNNNILERANGTVRERVKVMRGFDSAETAQGLLEGYRTYYNLLRPHMGLEGGFPALRAGIPVPTEGNRWMALIGAATGFPRGNGKAPSPAMKQEERNGSKLP